VTKPSKWPISGSWSKRALEKVTLVRERRPSRKPCFPRTVRRKSSATARSCFNVFRLIEKGGAFRQQRADPGRKRNGQRNDRPGTHQRSGGRQQPYVSFNCGGFTEELITNELFGHERGPSLAPPETKIGLLEPPTGARSFWTRSARCGQHAGQAAAFRRGRTLSAGRGSQAVASRCALDCGQQPGLKEWSRLIPFGKISTTGSMS